MKPVVSPPPPRAEWYFEGLSERNQWACYYYEYSRQSPTIPGNILKMRSFSPEGREQVQQFYLSSIKGDLIHDRKQNGHDKYSLLPLICPEFPEIPWLAIPPEVRLARLGELPDVARELYRPVKEFELASMAHDPASETAGNRSGLTEPPRDFAVVRLDWSLSDRALRKKFDCILQHRPRPEVRRKPGGRDNPLAGLRALAALRLRNHYKSISQVMAAKDQRLVEIRYDDERVLRAAVRRAEKILAAF